MVSAAIARNVVGAIVEQYSATPYLTTPINCMFWVLYGMPWKKRVKVASVVVGEVIIVVVLTVLVLTLLHTIHRRFTVIGIICVIFCTMTYASPLSVMKLVTRTKSVEYMPVSLSLATFANCVTWTCYAFLPYDPFILIPSVLGIAFSVSQLILYATYYKSTIEAAQKEAETGRLSLDTVGNGHSQNHNIEIPNV
ncbi:hypothetical protein SLA2020_238040 [Shorea laevis]